MLVSYKKLLLVFLLFAVVAFSQDSVEVKKDKTDVPSIKASMSEINNEHLSLLSPERITQFRNLTVGFTTDGKNSGSLLRYAHRIDYVLRPNLRTQMVFELSRFQTNGQSHTDITPTFRLDWKPSKFTSLSINLRLPSYILSDKIQGSSLMNKSFWR